MLVLCNGMPRSASTWSFNVAIGLLRYQADAAHVHGGYDEDVARFLGAIPEQSRHLVLKCHSLDPIGRALAQSGAAKVIYTWRNISDAIASFMRMFNVDFEHAFAVTHDSLQLYDFHRSVGNVVVLHYDEITKESLETVRRIDAYLGLDSSLDVIRSVGEQTSLSQMRAKVSILDSTANQERLIKLERTTYDPETLLNVNHIRDGSSGYGRMLLSVAQLARIAKLSREFSVQE
jgi:hypothetical protein